MVRSLTSKAKVYFKNCEEKNYYFRSCGFRSDVGINAELLKNSSVRLVFINKTTEIAPNVLAVTDINSKHEKPKGNQYLYTKSQSGCEQDSFDHE